MKKIIAFVVLSILPLGLFAQSGGQVIRDTGEFFNAIGDMGRLYMFFGLGPSSYNSTFSTQSQTSFGFGLGYHFLPLGRSVALGVEFGYLGNKGGYFLRGTEVSLKYESVFFNFLLDSIFHFGKNMSVQFLGGLAVGITMSPRLVDPISGTETILSTETNEYDYYSTPEFNSRDIGTILGANLHFWTSKDMSFTIGLRLNLGGAVYQDIGTTSFMLNAGVAFH